MVSSPRDQWHRTLSLVLFYFLFLSHFLVEDKEYTLILFLHDTYEERELIHPMITVRSKQLSEGTRKMA